MAAYKLLVSLVIVAGGHFAQLRGHWASTLYYYLHADGTLKVPGLKLLGGTAATAAGDPQAVTA